MVILKLRKEVVVSILKVDTQEYIELVDTLSLKISKLTAPITAIEIIKALIEGIKYEDTNRLQNNNVSSEFINYIIQSLEQYYFLDNTNTNLLVQKINNYLEGRYRPMVCGGSLYPTESHLFKQEIEKILNLSQQYHLERKNEVSLNQDVNLVFAPHIDFNIGLNALETYSKAFNFLFDLDYDIIVTIGTAHFRDTAYFMFSDKDYSTPLNNLKTDTDLIKTILDKITNNGPEPRQNSVELDTPSSGNKKRSVLVDNLAHFNEHSLELHLVFVSYVLDKMGKKIPILPILAGSVETGSNGNNPHLDIEYYKTLTDTIKNEILAKYKKVLFLCSGDLSHIGQKFSDNYDAIEKIDELIKFEKELLNLISTYNVDEYFDYLSKHNSCFKVCGYAPFYAGMLLAQKTKGILLDYSTWYERQEQSAVSFSSFIFN